MFPLKQESEPVHLGMRETRQLSKSKANHQHQTGIKRHPSFQQLPLLRAKQILNPHTEKVVRNLGK